MFPTFTVAGLPDPPPQRPSSSPRANPGQRGPPAAHVLGLKHQVALLERYGAEQDIPTSAMGRGWAGLLARAAFLGAEGTPRGGRGRGIVSQQCFPGFVSASFPLPPSCSEKSGAPHRRVPRRGGGAPSCFHALHPTVIPPLRSRNPWRSARHESRVR